jgi:LacI family transcriptional regulator, repressor for deo operon, udp, cdd, tsx, nupC, and nupG
MTVADDHRTASPSAGPAHSRVPPVLSRLDVPTGPVGIVEVAARAQVSPATVSRALRGSPGVSAPTRARVQAAAAELGYAPSASAAALARGRTSVIGVLAPWVSRWFFATVIDGAQQVVADAGYDLLLSPMVHSASSAAVGADIRTLSKKVDGILGLNVPRDALLDDLPGRQRIPVVTVGCTIPSLSGVQIDDHQVGAIATRHLLELGHRRIAFLGPDPDDHFGFRVAEERHDGYLQALAEAGFEPDPTLAIPTGFLVASGGVAFERLWDSVGQSAAAMPTAVVAVSDEVAMGVIHGARRRGLTVPGSLSVIGVDNHELGYLFDLTTVGQPAREQGALAAKMLIEDIMGCSDASPRVVRFEPELVVRGTTAPPRGAG